MKTSRLSVALNDGAVSLPENGRIAVFAAQADHDLSMLPKDRVDVIQGFKPDHDVWVARGFTVQPEVEGKDYALSIVMLPRAKAAARSVIATAAARTVGMLVIDGQKTDGIDGIWRDCRKRAEVTTTLTKAHGRLFVMAATNAFSDWIKEPGPGPDGFVTAPGVFSADKIDRGSRLLADALPKELGATIADLGAGWGYLSAHLLKRETIETLHLIEADHVALVCARKNISDPRARFHWADATAFKLPEPVDCVVTNPPFHLGRAGDPALGRAFITAAANLLTPRGTLWLVANRHLPYEAALAQSFRDAAEIGGDGGFKLLKASVPQRAPRPKR